MTTILGSHIDVIRPKKINLPIIRKADRPKMPFHKKPKTNENNSGKVKEVCIKVGQKIFALASGTHLDVMESFNLNPDKITATGWRLESGKYLWR